MSEQGGALSQDARDPAMISRAELRQILVETGSPPDLIAHVDQVCDRALQIAAEVKAAGLPVNLAVVQAGAMLHDAGIPLQTGEAVAVPELGELASSVRTDSLMHPILGDQVAQRYGFPLSVRRCILCHTPGPTRAECILLGLTPPDEELLPVAIEEKVVAYADFLLWCARLGLNPWQDEHVMATAGLLYYNIFWSRVLGKTLQPDREIEHRWIDLHRELHAYARPEWFGL